MYKIIGNASDNIKNVYLTPTLAASDKHVFTIDADSNHHYLSYVMLISPPDYQLMDVETLELIRRDDQTRTYQWAPTFDMSAYRHHDDKLNLTNLLQPISHLTIKLIYTHSK